MIVGEVTLTNIEWVSTPDPECVAVGCGGCRDESMREYPCNCRFCRYAYPETYHDGETTWWRCEFCGALFELDDMEILSGDSQACEPCVSGWRARECAKRSAAP